MLLILLALPVLSFAQNRHLDDIRSGESVQFEAKMENGTVFLAIRKFDEDILAELNTKVGDNEPESYFLIGEIKGEGLRFKLMDAPIKAFCHVTFDGDNAMLRFEGAERMFPIPRKELESENE